MESDDWRLKTDVLEVGFIFLGIASVYQGTES